MQVQQKKKQIKYDLSLPTWKTEAEWSSCQNHPNQLRNYRGLAKKYVNGRFSKQLSLRAYTLYHRGHIHTDVASQHLLCVSVTALISTGQPEVSQEGLWKQLSNRNFHDIYFYYRVECHIIKECPSSDLTMHWISAYREKERINSLNISFQKNFYRDKIVFDSRCVKCRFHFWYHI